MPIQMELINEKKLQKVDCSMQYKKDLTFYSFVEYLWGISKSSGFPHRDGKSPGDLPA